MSELDPRSRSLDVKRSKSFLLITPVKTVLESRYKNKKIYSLFNSLNISKYEYSIGLIFSRIGGGQRSKSGYSEIDYSSLKRHLGLHIRLNLNTY